QVVAQLLDAVGLVDAGLGDVDRRRAAHANGEVGQQWLQDRRDPLALGEIGVPALLGAQRRLLAQHREGDLATAILNRLAPDLLHFDARDDGDLHETEQVAQQARYLRSER